MTARTDGGAHAVPGPGVGAPGLHIEPLDSVDLVRRFATVHFDGVQVPVSAVVGEVGGAAAAVERQLQLAIVLQSAETVGALDRVLEFTLEYLPTAARSDDRWRRTRRSSTASPT